MTYEKLQYLAESYSVSDNPKIREGGLMLAGYANLLLAGGYIPLESDTSLLATESIPESGIFHNSAGFDYDSINGYFVKDGVSTHLTLNENAFTKRLYLTPGTFVSNLKLSKAMTGIEDKEYAKDAVKVFARRVRKKLPVPEEMKEVVIFNENTYGYMIRS